MNGDHEVTHPHTILLALETVIQKIFADDHKPKAFSYLSKRTLWLKDHERPRRYLQNYILQ